MARKLNFVMFLVLVVLSPVGAETWRGLIVAPEKRCSPYDRGDYSFPQPIEREIVRGLGRVYSPYTGTCFESMRQTDIEHMVATIEAHDSGLCARDRETRARFASDLRNLTLAGPTVNRHEKGGKDAAEWLPDRNQCWFAGRILEIRQAYDLTIDRREAAALEAILSQCEDFDMEQVVCDGQDRSGLRVGSREVVDEDTWIQQLTAAEKTAETMNNLRVMLADTQRTLRNMQEKQVRFQEKQAREHGKRLSESGNEIKELKQDIELLKAARNNTGQSNWGSGLIFFVVGGIVTGFATVFGTGIATVFFPQIVEITTRKYGELSKSWGMKRASKDKHEKQR